MIPQSHAAQVPVLSPAMFEASPGAWLPVVASLLDEQRRLCQELESLGIEQSGYVASGRTDDLLSVLSRRQVVLDRVVEINQALDPFRDRREAIMSTLQSADREKLQRRIDAIAESVDRVRRRDDQDRRLLEEQRQIVADEISGITRVKGAAAAYAGAGAVGLTSGVRGFDAPAPRFHDRHG